MAVQIRRDHIFPKESGKALEESTFKNFILKYGKNRTKQRYRRKENMYKSIKVGKVWATVRKWRVVHTQYTSDRLL